jgi:hypothetical protein
MKKYKILKNGMVSAIRKISVLLVSIYAFTVKSAVMHNMTTSKSNIMILEIYFTNEIIAIITFCSGVINFIREILQTFHTV